MMQVVAKPHNATQHHAKMHCQHGPITLRGISSYEKLYNAAQ